jgi:uncharacterized protein (TIGR02145 family)
MKKILKIFFLFFLISLSGIAASFSLAGNDEPGLHSQSAEKSPEIKTMTYAERMAVKRPETGMFVFQTDENPGFYYNSGTPARPEWQKAPDGIFSFVADSVAAAWLKVLVNESEGGISGRKQVLRYDAETARWYLGDENISVGKRTGEMLFWDGNQWVEVRPGTTGQVLTFCYGIPTWGGCLPRLSSTSLTMINDTSAVMGGVITETGGTAVTGRGVCWSLSPNPTISNQKTVDGNGSGAFASTINGLQPTTTYYARAYATNSTGTAYGNTITFTTGISPLLCGTFTVKDADGNVYNTIPVGRQCWLKENLRTTKYRNNAPIANLRAKNEWQFDANGAYTWYANNTSWKDKYGALYNWYAATSENGLCPPGWRVPTDEDWTALEQTVGGRTDERGDKLKSCRQINSPLGGECSTNEHPRFLEHGTHHGTDVFSFGALPGGYRSFTADFHNMGNYGTWWTSTDYSETNAWSRSLYYNTGEVTRSYFYKTLGFSVRCLREQ